MGWLALQTCNCCVFLWFNRWRKWSFFLDTLRSKDQQLMTNKLWMLHSSRQLKKREWTVNTGCGCGLYLVYWIVYVHSFDSNGAFLLKNIYILPIRKEYIEQSLGGGNETIIRLWSRFHLFSVCPNLIASSSFLTWKLPDLRTKGNEQMTMTTRMTSRSQPVRNALCLTVPRSVRRGCVNRTSMRCCYWKLL